MTDWVSISKKIRELPEMLDIVKAQFTPGENLAMINCPPESRLDLFYRFWTRKEAVLKAQGEGLLLPLDCVDVSAGGEGQPFKVKVLKEKTAEEFLGSGYSGPAGFRSRHRFRWSNSTRFLLRILPRTLKTKADTVLKGLGISDTGYRQRRRKTRNEYFCLSGQRRAEKAKDQSIAENREIDEQKRLWFLLTSSIFNLPSISFKAPQAAILPEIGSLIVIT